MLRGVAAAIARETVLPGMQPPYFCNVGVVRRSHAPLEPPHDFFAPSQHMLRALPLHDSDAPCPDLHTTTERRLTTDETQAQREIHKKGVCRTPPRPRRPGASQGLWAHGQSDVSGHALGPCSSSPPLEAMAAGSEAPRPRWLVVPWQHRTRRPRSEMTPSPGQTRPVESRLGTH